MNTTRRLGKLAPQHDPARPRLARYLAAHLPPPPPSVNWAAAVKQWGLYRNDEIGDCTEVGLANLVTCWGANSHGFQVSFPDSAIVTAYSQVSGYSPVTGENDNGAVEADVLRQWQATGVAGHKIEGWADVRPADGLEVRQAVALFGGLYVGLDLPETAAAQLDAGQPWTAPAHRYGPSAPGSWGGHAVPLVAYDSNWLWCVTWGRLQPLSWGFLAAYCDEAHAVLSREWLDRMGKAPSGLDLETLRRDLRALGPAHLAA